MKTKRESTVIALTWLCTAIYFCSYLTRINFAAVLVEIIETEQFSKAAISIAVTGLSITYGAGQLVSGYLGDKVKPQWLIFIGLLASAVFNLLIPLCSTTTLMTVIWSMNGFAQAMMWPPIVKILSSRMDETDYKYATVRVSWGSSFGTIFIYLAAPVMILTGSWKTVFMLSAAAAVLMAFIWMYSFRRLERKFTTDATIKNLPALDSSKSSFTPSVILLLAVIMFGIIMQGILRDGITTWMPTYISEIFRTDNSVAIFSSIVLPLFSIACYQFTAWLNRRFLKNEMVCAAAVFALGLVSLLLLRMLGRSGMLISVASLGIAAAAMHGVNLVLICMVPAFFSKFGRSALISGVLNCCTYVGSAVSTYGVAVLSEAFGWDFTVFVWICVALIGTLACVALIHRWKTFKNSI